MVAVIEFDEETARRVEAVYMTLYVLEQRRSAQRPRGHVASLPTIRHIRG